jgi:Fe2+ or Zn2+ uptake regulation protein
MGKITENISGKHSERRMRQIGWLLQMAEIISSRHFGITLDELRREMDEAGEAVCARTVYRYVGLLVDLGYVQREEVYLMDRRAIRYRFTRKLPRTLVGA